RGLSTDGDTGIDLRSCSSNRSLIMAFFNTELCHVRYLVHLPVANGRWRIARSWQVRPARAPPVPTDPKMLIHAAIMELLARRQSPVRRSVLKVFPRAYLPPLADDRTSVTECRAMSAATTGAASSRAGPHHARLR